MVSGRASDEQEWVARSFEAHRRHLEAVSYRMLGSHAEAEDAVQDTWIRFSRAGPAGVENLGGWLTTIVARVCLNKLRSRAARREEPLEFHLADPVLGTAETGGPEQQALISDAVSLALITVLDALRPAERLAFVLHDMFDVSFDEIGPIVERSPAAARQLASRARRRVRATGASVAADDLPAQRRVVNAFFAAARGADFESLVGLLDPDAVLRADGGTTRAEASSVLRGSALVARRATLFDVPGAELHPILVNGEAGVVVAKDGTLVSVMGFTISRGVIAEVDILLDPERLARIDPAVFDNDDRPQVIEEVGRE